MSEAIKKCDAPINKLQSNSPYHSPKNLLQLHFREQKDKLTDVRMIQTYVGTKKSTHKETNVHLRNIEQYWRTIEIY